MPVVIAESADSPGLVKILLDSSDLNDLQKSALEEEARLQGCSISEFLGRLVDQKSLEILKK
jgi:hypothetical protein